MNVDRARFLLLTTALSAASAVAASATGCSATTNTTDAGSTTPINGDDSGLDSGLGADAYATDGSTDDGSVCLDDTGADPDCTGANATCTTTCQHYLTNYKKGVARSITQCIIALPTCESATMEIAACVQKALGDACSDPTAEGFCDPMVTACGVDAGVASLDKTECADLATGLSTAGRTAFTSCVQEGMGTTYCKADPSTCFDTIE